MPIINMVYKKKKWKYTYDFINKTTTQLTNDGWINASWLTTGSNWVTSTNWVALWNEVNWLWTAMSNAKKVTMSFTTYSNNSWTGVAGFLIVQDANNTWETGLYTEPRQYEFKIIWNRLTKPSSSQWTGDRVATYTFDFENKQATYSYAWSSNTYTLTDAQISWAKQCKRIYCPLSTAIYLKNLSITIE